MQNISQNKKFKRLLSYMIDIFVISFLCSLVSNIKVLNPNYNKYIETYNNFESYITQIASNEDVTTLISSEYVKYIYKLSYYSLSSIIIEFVIVMLYFTLFPYYNKGQTIGKRIFKINVTKNDNTKLKLKDHCLRSFFIPLGLNIIMYNNIYNIINVILILTLKNRYYVYSLAGVCALVSIYCLVDVIMILTSKEGISLHDRICKTKVIEEN